MTTRQQTIFIKNFSQSKINIKSRETYNLYCTTYTFYTTLFSTFTILDLKHRFVNRIAKPLR